MLGGSVLYCGRLLAGLGATTILIEPPQGAPERRFPPFAPGPLGANSSMNFAFNAAGLRSVAVDATTLDGAAVLGSAVSAADVVVNALGWEGPSVWNLACQELLRGCTSTSVCNLGPDGPFAGIGADELLIQAASGHLYVSGFAEGEPMSIPTEMGKLQNSLLGAVTVLSLLIDQDDGPRTANVRAQASLALTTLQTSNPGFYTWRDIVPKRAGAEGIGGVSYKCTDGYVAFTVPGERWGAFISWLDELGIEREGLPTVLDGQVDSMRAALARARTSVESLAGRMTKRELYHAAQRRGILCMPVNSLGEVLDDEHLQARDFFIKDANGAADLLAPFRFDPPLWNLNARAPSLGEFTEAYLSTALGYSRQDVESLLAMGAISCGL